MVNSDVRIIYAYLLDGAVMVIKIVPMEQMRRIAPQSLVPTTNLIVQKADQKALQNVSKKANFAMENETVWMELMNEKLVVSWKVFAF